VADLLDREPDGLASSDLMARLRGRGSHRWAAVAALRDVGLVEVSGAAPRIFRARLTSRGHHAVASERIRRAGVDPQVGPVLPPRDSGGRLIITVRDPPLSTLAPGELWGRTMELLGIFRASGGPRAC
jgi:hypothetical protein